MAGPFTQVIGPPDGFNLGSSGDKARKAAHELRSEIKWIMVTDHSVAANACWELFCIINPYHYILVGKSGIFNIKTIWSNEVTRVLGFAWAGAPPLGIWTPSSSCSHKRNSC